MAVNTFCSHWGSLEQPRLRTGNSMITQSIERTQGIQRTQGLLQLQNTSIVMTAVLFKQIYCTMCYKEMCVACLYGLCLDKGKVFKKLL